MLGRGQVRKTICARGLRWVSERGCGKMLNMLNETDQTDLRFVQRKTARAGQGSSSMARKKSSTAVRHVPMREFSRSLPMSLLRAREAVMRHFRPSLRRHGLTEQQWRILRALAA